MNCTAHKRTHVTQHELHRVARYDADIKEAQAELARLQRERADLETDLLAFVDGGLPVQPGKLELEVTSRPGRRCPKWKAICQEHLGDAFVETTIASTDPVAAKWGVAVKPSC